MAAGRDERRLLLRLAALLLLLGLSGPAATLAGYIEVRRRRLPAWLALAAEQSLPPSAIWWLLASWKSGGPSPRRRLWNGLPLTALARSLVFAVTGCATGQSRESNGDLLGKQAVQRGLAQ